MPPTFKPVALMLSIAREPESHIAFDLMTAYSLFLLLLKTLDRCWDVQRLDVRPD